jgi:uncharacterized protein YaeQ
MALKSTIFKAELSVADIDRGYYRDHELTIARHPSETDEREVRKACGRANEVYVLAYGGRAVDLWWQGAREKLERQDRLAVSEVTMEASRALARMAGRFMRLQVTIQEEHILVADGATSVAVEPRVLKAMSIAR